MKVSIIAAIGENRELGKGNKLIWHIKEDLQRFKALTAGHPIIMGRKTWDSLPLKPLPNRINIVVTRNSNFQKEGIIVCNSLEQAIKKAAASVQGSSEPKEVFIIGGGQIYAEALKKELVDKLYLTIVDVSADADTFFPDYSHFKKVISKEDHDSGEYKFTFVEFER